MIDDDILSKINDEMSRDGVPHRRRSFEALSRLSRELGVSVAFPSPLADHVMAWFKARIKPGADLVGALSTSAYFFDAEFWAVRVPVFYGTCSLQPLDALTDMPPATKERVGLDYLIWWADCMDYALGLPEVVSKYPPRNNGIHFLEAADQELRSGISLVLERQPSERSILPFRMATEMFLKAFIALKQGLSDSQARAINHDLKAGLREFCKAGGGSAWMRVEPQLGAFPPISGRYQKQVVSRKGLWVGLTIAHALGASVVRAFAEVDTRVQVVRSLEATNKGIEPDGPFGPTAHA